MNRIMSRKNINMLFLTSFLVLCKPWIVYPQKYNNHLISNFGVHHISNVRRNFTPGEFGITMLHSIHEKILVSFSFQTWFLEEKDGLKLNVAQTAYEQPGSTIAKYGYKFFDLGFRYYIYYHKVFDIYFGSGLSAAAGRNKYVSAITYSFASGHFEKDIRIDSRAVIHFGSNLILGYDLKFRNERFRIGMSSCVRFLSSATQYYDISINTGYSFNFRKQ